MRSIHRPEGGLKATPVAVRARDGDPDPTVALFAELYCRWKCGDFRAATRVRRELARQTGWQVIPPKSWGQGAAQ